MRLVVPAGVVAIVLSAQPLFGESVVLAPIRDNTLYESAGGLASNGAGDNVFAGLTSVGQRRRALIAFDVAGRIPAKSVITRAELTLHLSKTMAGSTDIELHRTLRDWGEGGSNGTQDEGMGAPPTPGDVTWSHAFFDTASWTIPGGDFDPVASASRAVDAPPPASFTWGPSAAMTSDVQSWLDDPTTNFGWLLKGHESATGNVKRFDSKEDTIPSFRPMLVVEYDPPGEDSLPDPLPSTLELKPASPNPFRLTTTIIYSLPEETRATLTILNVSGRRVATLVDGVRPQGPNTVVWDGKDIHGNRGAPGIYLARLESGGRTRIAKLLLIR